MDTNLHKKLTSLSEITKLQLSKILNSIAGPKDLILETNIIKPLERICGLRWLRNNNVDKIFKLGSEGPTSSASLQFYIIYANMRTFKFVVDIIRSQLDFENPIKGKFHIVIVPNVLSVFDEILEELGLYGLIVQLYPFFWQPIHLDAGILSLELPNFYRNLFVNFDCSLLPAFAKSLWHLFHVTGKPVIKLALGKYSKVILEHLNILSEELAPTDKFNTDFGGLVLLDRDVDYTSALLTPATYTALMHEVLQISCGICECKATEIKKYDSKFNLNAVKPNIQLNLDSTNDTVYNDIKHRYFTEVTSILSNVTKQLRTESENSKDMALEEMKKFVATQLQATASKKKFITNHLQISETIINVLGRRFERQQEVEKSVLQCKSRTNNYEFLEEMTVTENNKFTPLRLLCLMAIANRLSDGEIKNYLSKYVQEYGHSCGQVYNNLLKVNITNEANFTSLPNIVSKIPILTMSNFHGTANKLKQIPSNPQKINTKSPTCCSYVFGGAYIPLITQLANMLLQNVPTTEIKAKLDSIGPLLVQNDGAQMLQQKSVLIVVVGGITYSEIAACNLLEVLTGGKIVVCSDRVVTGNDLMEALVDSDCC